MSKPTYRRPFLEQLHLQWAERLPDWHPGVSEPIWWADARSTFHRSIRHSGRDLLAHLSIYFTPKWPGAFTADIVISTIGESLPSRPSVRWGDHVSTLLLGQYRIGWFGRGCDYWWHLMDEATTHFGRRMEPSSRHWYSNTYADFPAVLSQALEDFTLCVEQEVIPKLHLDA